VLPPAEIDFVDYAPDKPKVVGYRAKWDADSFEYHHTPRRFDFPAEDASLLRQLTAIAKDCWRILGVRGYVRVDFRLDRDGKPWVLEVNANPCLSPDAGFFAAAQRAGLGFEQVIERILADAFRAAPASN
jgi:D-alanine-D-alanine ligase